MLKRPILPLVSLLALAACPAPKQGAPAAPCPTAPEHTANPVLGVVDGEKIRRTDLSDEIDKELKKGENDVRQREFHLLWNAVQAHINDKLLEQEAERRNMSIEQLRDEEIGSRVLVPSDEIVESIYSNNREVIDADFETAAPHIKRQLMEEQVSDLQRAFLARLRNVADVRIAVPVPELPRFPVTRGNSPLKGKRDAKVTIIEFSDFECPYCSRASQTFKKLHELYPEDVAIVFRDFPLSQHEQARPAAEAAQCAREQGKFWEYHDILFLNMRALKGSDLKTYAEDLGLDMEAFAACLASERPKKVVDEHMAAARKIGVEGTPAIYVNGIKLIGLLPLPMMQAIIDHELDAD
jgi:protein-disulfide isomerase